MSITIVSQQRGQKYVFSSKQFMKQMTPTFYGHNHVCIGSHMDSSTIWRDYTSESIVSLPTASTIISQSH